MGSSRSISSPTTTSTTTYQNIQPLITKKIQASKKITYMAIYKSPLNNIPLLPQHYETIIQLDKLIWLLINWCDEGLEIQMGFEKQGLIKLRQNNTQVKFSNTEHDSQRLKNFLEQHQNKRYNVVNWNCRHYAQTMWKKLHSNSV